MPNKSIKETIHAKGFKIQAGANAFTMSPKKWIDATNAIGIVSKSGRYGGTFAPSDIAFEFASWISPEFKLYIIKDYQRLILHNINFLLQYSGVIMCGFAYIFGIDLIVDVI